MRSRCSVPPGVKLTTFFSYYLIHLLPGVRMLLHSHVMFESPNYPFPLRRFWCLFRAFWFVFACIRCCLGRGPEAVLFFSTLCYKTWSFSSSRPFMTQLSPRGLFFYTTGIKRLLDVGQVVPLAPSPRSYSGFLRGEPPSNVSSLPLWRALSPPPLWLLHLSF